ncbi:MAG TPA: F0F1 ATP synthase subunit B [Candidatus Methylomirabilis sp.]|nr:F0F1 ATP synthase subunit B [Candidatus Methylomirabilis sp.]
MKIFSAFGLDIKILIAQLINFAILLFILWKFAYKPMFKILDDRKKKIETGIENAVKAEEKLKEIGEEEKKVMIQAKKEAAKILDEAKVMAEESRKKNIEKTKEEIGQLINQEKENMRLEKAEILKSINREVADLVVATVEKVIAEKMTGAKDEELIKKAIGKLK